MSRVRAHKGRSQQENEMTKICHKMLHTQSNGGRVCFEVIPKIAWLGERPIMDLIDRQISSMIMRWVAGTREGKSQSDFQKKTELHKSRLNG